MLCGDMYSIATSVYSNPAVHTGTAGAHSRNNKSYVVPANQLFPTCWHCIILLPLHASAHTCRCCCSEYSKTLNEARLKVLAAREAAIQTVVKEARGKVREAAKNPNTYRKMMQDLLVQVRVGTLAGTLAFHCWMDDVRIKS
jgi:hypothetical protein